MNSNSKPFLLAHIAAHVGGGVGTVLRDLLRQLNRHSIENDLFCLDICKDNFDSFDGARRKLHGMSYDYSTNRDLHFLDYDLVIVHYWNHPLIAHFLTSNKIPSCRLMIWSHISGLFEPNIIPSYLLNISQKILLSSECSYQAPNIKSLSRLYPQKFSVVHSSRDTTLFKSISSNRRTNSERKRALYVGTVSKAKMHVMSAEIFSRLSKTGFDVQVIGGPEQEHLKQEVTDLGGAIETPGPIADVTEALRLADIFIYPLNPYHYGTGEQVVLEAMASGLPVVAFNNPAEAILVKNNETGFLVETVEQFLASVIHIVNHRDIYDKMSQLARTRSITEFAIESMVEKFIENCTDLLKRKKRKPRFSLATKKQLESVELYALHSLFNNAVTEHSKATEEPVSLLMLRAIQRSIKTKDMLRLWCSETKGSPKHYLKFFPNSVDLALLSQKLEQLT